MKLFSPKKKMLNHYFSKMLWLASDSYWLLPKSKFSRSKFSRALRTVYKNLQINVQKKCWKESKNDFNWSRFQRLSNIAIIFKSTSGCEQKKNKKQIKMMNTLYSKWIAVYDSQVNCECISFLLYITINH